MAPVLGLPLRSSVTLDKLATHNFRIHSVHLLRLPLRGVVNIP